MTLPVSRPITVLQICPGEADARISMNFVRHQANDLRSIGVDVKEVFIEDRQSLLGILKGRAAVRAACRLWKPDIVHAQYGTVTAVVALISARWPLFITFRGSDLNPDGTSSKIKMASKIVMSQFGALFATQIITVSEQLRHRLWWRNEGAVVIPSGVDLRRFTPMDRSMARRQLGWDFDSPVLLFNAGFNHVNKRLDLAEEVLARVKKDCAHVRLHIMEGKTDPDDVPVLMNACDVLLMLSDNEGSPNVVREALACDLPVVSFEVGDVVTWLRGVGTGAVVPRCTNLVANAVIEYLRRGGRSKGSLGASAFSAESSAKRVLALYKKTMSRK